MYVVIALVATYFRNKFNCWVMHPVARVSTNTLIKTTIRNKCFSCSILLCTTTTCFGPDRWPSSGKMYTKIFLKRPLCMSIFYILYLFLHIDILFFYNTFIWLTWLWHLPLYSWLNGSVDIYSSHFKYIFCVHSTWRWSPIGAETCCSSAQ
jgi:hypothetical protein